LKTAPDEPGTATFHQQPMKTLPLISVALTLVTVVAAQAADETRTERVKFEAGKTSGVISSKITGRESVVYKLNARDGQFLDVRLESDNESTDFNIYIPGRGPGDEALFASAMGDGSRHYLGQLYKTGDHSISVFMNRAAARQGKTSNFKITFQITDGQPGGGAPAAGGAKFDKSASYGKISFRVTSPQAAESNSFTITPAGLSVSNEPVTMQVNGKVTDVMAQDIDGDNSPEAAVIVESANGRRTASVFTTFAGKSFGQVNFPEPSAAGLFDGYEGGDEYEMMENTFVRRFPLKGQAAKTRQLQFKLKPGEAMKQLVFDRHSDF
jgi:hypothetical protein